MLTGAQDCIVMGRLRQGLMLQQAHSHVGHGDGYVGTALDATRIWCLKKERLEKFPVCNNYEIQQPLRILGVAIDLGIGDERQVRVGVAAATTTLSSAQTKSNVCS